MSDPGSPTGSGDVPLISVVVPARDAQSTLARTLEALAAQELDGGYEVLVVDDGSRDDTAAIARSAPGPISVLTQPALGPAAARNLGVERARAQAIAFCDADVYPTPGWLSAGLAALEQADLVQGRVLPSPDWQLGPFDRSLWITGEVGLWEAANLFVRREVFESVGGFEQWLEPRRGKALAEDVWFGYKAKRAGARSSFCSAALAHHAVFSRGARDYVAERWRRQYFPAMARKTPELRETFFYRRLFLDRRTARFDLALSAAALAAISHRRLALAAALPYLRALRSGASRCESPTSAAAAAGADLAADAVSLAALVYGSCRYKSLVL